VHKRGAYEGQVNIKGVHKTLDALVGHLWDNWFNVVVRAFIRYAIDFTV